MLVHKFYSSSVLKEQGAPRSNGQRALIDERGYGQENLCIKINKARLVSINHLVYNQRFLRDHKNDD